jgi:hypothetical protein
MNSGKEGRRAHEGHGIDEGRRIGGREGAVAEEIERQDRVAHPPLHEDEARQRRGSEREKSQHYRGGPGVFPPAPGHRQEQRHEAGDQQARAQPVDTALAPGRHGWHLDQDHRHGDEREGDVDVEDPAPARDHVPEQDDRSVVGEEAADHRAEHAGQAEDRAEQAGELGPLPRRVELGDDRERRGEERAAAQALQRAEEDQLGHAAAQYRQGPELAGETGQPRAGEEDGDAGQQHRLSPVEVAQLAPDRHHHRRGEQIGRGRPGVEVQAGELGDDSRHGRADHRLAHSERRKTMSTLMSVRRRSSSL